MSRCYPLLAIVIVTSGVALAAYVKEPQLPPDAKITRNKDGSITGINLSGRSSADKAKIRPEVLQQISAISTLELLDLSFSDLTDEALGPLKNLRSLKVLNLTHSNVTGKAIRTLSHPPNLLVLKLVACKVTDDDLKALSDMPQLVDLHLQETEVTDVGLPQIAKLSELIVLDLRNCAITDKGLRSLGHFKQIQHLMLSKTTRHGEDDRSKLTDASVEYLGSLKTLVSLDIADSQLTDQGLTRLRNALPRTKIDTTRLGVTYLPAKSGKTTNR